MTFTAGSGAVSFGGIVGGSTALTSLAVTSTTGITLTGNVTTTGAQSYTGAVTLAANSTLATTNSAVSFSSTVKGAKALTIAAGSGAVTFGGIVGGTTALSSVTVTAAGINQRSITTSGAQRYTGAVTLAAGSTLATTAAPLRQPQIAPKEFGK